MIIEFLLLIELILIIYFINKSKNFSNMLLLSVIYTLQPLSLIFFWSYKIFPYRIIPFFILGIMLISKSLSFKKRVIDSRKIYFHAGIDTLLLSSNSYYAAFLLLLSVFLIEYQLSDAVFGFLSLMIIFLSISLIFYEHVPKIYKNEFQCLILFFGFFILQFSLPIISDLLISKEFNFNSSYIFNDDLVYTYLGIPIANFLNLFDYNIVAYGDTLSYPDFTKGVTSKVSIGQACTGFYSVIIFLSAFFSFVFVNYGKFDSDVLLYLLLGIILCYMANILRMIIIILVGIHYGSEWLVWTHTNIGWLIFVTWLFIFWFLMEKNINFRGKRF